MADLEDLLDAGAVAIAAAVNGGAADPVEVTRAALRRAEAAPANAFVTVDGERAEAEARALADRLARGERPLLAGVPIAHKDLLDVAGVPTTAGNPAWRHVPDRDATVVARSRAAGAVSVGKASLHEAAYGVTGDNPHLGPVENPAAPGHMAGGSSSGSAALVAAGVVAVSLGTDTGGSVRIPASACGVVGLKTTLGCVPTTGVAPLSWAQDTVGPIARRAEDAGLLLAAVAGPDGEDPLAAPLPAGWSAWPVAARAPEQVVVPPALWEGRVDPRVAERCRTAVDALGATVIDHDLRGLSEARTAQAVLLAANASAVHAERFERDPGAYGADVRERLERARALTGAEVARALRTREEWIAELRALLAPGTLLACPTLAFIPPRYGDTTVTWDDGEEEVTPALTRHTGVFNLAGAPAVSVPVGTVDGVPVGLQFVGPRSSEGALLGVARAVEAALGRG